MATYAQAIQVDWNQLCASARSRWHQVTDEDFRIAEGNVEQLVSRIQQKTGEAREVIERFFSEMTARGASAVASANEAANEYVRRAGNQIRERYDGAEHLVRRHPTETVVMALGVGLMAGLIAGLAIRGR